MTGNARRRNRMNRVLIEARLRKGLTPNALARKAGVSGNSVRAAERGEYVTPHIQVALAEVVELDQFVLFPFDRQRESA